MTGWPVCRRCCSARCADLIQVTYARRVLRIRQDLVDEIVAHARTLRRNNEIYLNTVTVTSRGSGEVVATGSVTYRIVVTE